MSSSHDEAFVVKTEVRNGRLYLYEDGETREIPVPIRVEYKSDGSVVIYAPPIVAGSAAGNSEPPSLKEA